MQDFAHGVLNWGILGDFAVPDLVEPLLQGPIKPDNDGNIGGRSFKCDSTHFSSFGALPRLGGAVPPGCGGRAHHGAPSASGGGGSSWTLVDHSP